MTFSGRPCDICGDAVCWKNECMAKIHEMHHKEHAAIFYGVERKAAETTRSGKVAAMEARARAEQALAPKSCYECDDAAGVHRMETRYGWRCDRCEIQHWKELHADKRQHLIDLLVAIGADPDDVAHTFDYLVPRAVEKVKLMREECEEPRQDPIWGQGIAEQLTGINSVVRGVGKVMESGPGLAARYPDATKAAKPEQEIITCDLGADYE